MHISFAYLVVVDISGYTRFITERTLTLTHAEQIITDLINAVLDQSYHPMILNKLEGDAALMYRELERDDVDGARDVLGQVRSFFPAFNARAAELCATRKNCSCDACSNILALTLKAFVHVGEIAIKQIRQFDELAGEPVILLHRLMKNKVESREYVLLTSAAAQHAHLNESALRSHVEDVEGMGTQRLWIATPESLPEPLKGRTPEAAEGPPRAGTGVYHHLPVTRASFYGTITNWFRRRVSHGS